MEAAPIAMIGAVILVDKLVPTSVVFLPNSCIFLPASLMDTEIADGTFLASTCKVFYLSYYSDFQNPYNPLDRLHVEQFSCPNYSIPPSYHLSGYDILSKPLLISNSYPITPFDKFINSSGPDE